MKEFYVYQLEDPADGQPFYVGKGKGFRAWTHTNMVRRGRSSGNKRKDAKITVILASGSEPKVTIVARYDHEDDAYDHEIDLIASLPGLLNIGRGGEGFRLAPAEQERRAKIRNIKVRHRDWVRSRPVLADWYIRIASYSGHKPKQTMDWLECTRELLSHEIPSLESQLANI